MWLPSFQTILLPFSILNIQASYSLETLVGTYKTTGCHSVEHHNVTTPFFFVCLPPDSEIEVDLVYPEMVKKFTVEYCS
jgi:hypothetical protein